MVAVMQLYAFVKTVYTGSIHVKFKNEQNHCWVMEVRIIITSGWWMLTGRLLGG